MPVSYLIVDDEAPSRRNLRLAMAAHPDWQLAAESDSCSGARGALSEHPVDVVFLDIQMPVESGLVLAREISRMEPAPLVVFLTAYSEHALDAFDVHALDYLMKPLSDRRLAQAIERATAMLGQRERAAYSAALRDFAGAGEAAAARPDYLHVRSVGCIEQVRFADIEWLEAAGNYVELHLAGRMLLHRVTLSRLEALLPPADFVRVHRSAMVRRDRIASWSRIGDGTYQLMLRCGAQVPVSERYVDGLKTAG